MSDPLWTRAFFDPAPLDKAHGARVVITYNDGTILEDELRVANAHPSGAAAYGIDDYRKKFHRLSEGIVSPEEAARFLSCVEKLPTSHAQTQVDLSVRALSYSDARQGLFDTNIERYTDQK